MNEVIIVSSKYFENDDTDQYCAFYFDSLNQLSDTELVISYRSRIKEKRDQYNYYITDKDYCDETIYYYLDINDDIITRICSTKKNSFLHKIGNTFYFLLNQSEKYSIELKETLKDYEFIEIKVDKIDFTDFYCQNKTILGWKGKFIYYGKIYSNGEYEKIKNNYKCKNNIISICLNPKIIFY